MVLEGSWRGSQVVGAWTLDAPRRFTGGSTAVHRRLHGGSTLLRSRSIASKNHGPGIRVTECNEPGLQGAESPHFDASSSISLPQPEKCHIYATTTTPNRTPANPREPRSKAPRTTLVAPNTPNHTATAQPPFQSPRQAMFLEYRLHFAPPTEPAYRPHGAKGSWNSATTHFEPMISNHTCKFCRKSCITSWSHARGRGTQFGDSRALGD